MKLGPHFEVIYNSDAQSELERSFIFEFEADIPRELYLLRITFCFKYIIIRDIAIIKTFL